MQGVAPARQRYEDVKRRAERPEDREESAYEAGEAGVFSIVAISPL